MNLTQYFILILAVVVMACALVLVRGWELKEGYRMGRLVARYDELYLELKKTQSQIYKLKSPRILQDRAIALGVKLVDPVERKPEEVELALATGSGLLTR